MDRNIYSASYMRKLREDRRALDLLIQIEKRLKKLEKYLRKRGP